VLVRTAAKTPATRGAKGIASAGGAA
jgi:hypothetical protein